jgi:hypothetical protein
MSKKRFTDGLDDLLNTPPALHESTPEPDATPERPRRASGGKTFSTDLDALLSEALEESLEKLESGKQLQHKVKKEDRPERLTGLDALIRQTLNMENFTIDEETGKKRLTVAVDKMKLDKLKVIARLENAYLKDIMVSLIDEYIQSYTQEKGINL